MACHLLSLMLNPYPFIWVVWHKGH